MPINNKKVLVITSCSAKKKKESMKAIDLYEGDFFKKVKKFVKLHNFDFRIISAKYGLLSPDDEIPPYNEKIKNSDDIVILQKKIIPKLYNIINKYDKILILMGEDYKNIIKPISNENFIYFFDNRGLGGYKSLLTHLIKMERKNLSKLLFYQKEKIITVDLIKKYNNNYKTFKIQ